MSFREKFRISDADGTVLYECAAQWSWFNRIWVLTREGKEVAVLTRKLWTLVETWDVKTDDDRFRLRGKLWSLRRRINVQGGRFDGAALTGNFFDLKFELSFLGQILARASGKVLTIRSSHDIELFDDSPQVELLTAILMSTLLIEKRQERDSTANSESS